MNISKSMKIAMAECGINQKELAVITGLTEATLSRISRKKGSPSFATIAKIAKATDWTVNDFIALGNEK